MRKIFRFFVNSSRWCCVREFPWQTASAPSGRIIADAKARAIVLAMEQEVAASAPFYEALEHSGAFPNYLVHMVEIGEKAGKLDDVMEALGAHYSREAQLKKNLRSAVLYPLALVLMMSAVIAVLVIKVLPIFNDVFRDLGAEMSDASAFVMNLGVGIAKYAFVVILILAVVLAAALLYSRTSRGSARMARLLSRFGPTKGISARVASARFASVMSMMLTSGYDTDAALELAPKVISNDLVARKIEQARSAVAGGKSFADAVVSAGAVPGNLWPDGQHRHENRQSRSGDGQAGRHLQRRRRPLHRARRVDCPAGVGGGALGHHRRDPAGGACCR